MAPLRYLLIIVLLAGGFLSVSAQHPTASFTDPDSDSPLGEPLNESHSGFLPEQNTRPTGARQTPAAHSDIHWEPALGEPTNQTWHRARIYLAGKPLRELAALGLAVDHVKQRAGRWVETDFSETELQTARNAGFWVEVIQPNVQDYYRERAAAQQKTTLTDVFACHTGTQYPVPTNFSQGSMGGFYTYAELLTALDSMHAKYPDLITARTVIDSSRPTAMGNYVYQLRLSDNPNTDENEPEVLYSALHHAREPGSMQSLVYFMWFLLENYGTNPEVTYLVDNTEMYFVPCINPDGYLYNETTNPNGGGMWRKNRRDNGDGTFGVDLNRNYGHEWGFDDAGSSPDPSSDVYRGPSAFSEPETQVMRELCEERNFLLAFNYHTFSDLIIYPWGYLPSFTTPDNAHFQHITSEQTRDNNYIYGTGDQTVGYVTNGDSDDWMYGEQTTKNKILSMTPEAGSADDGFWPAPARIVPICQDNMRSNLLLSHTANALVRITDLSPRFIGPAEDTLHIRLQRLGLKENVPYQVTVEDLNNSLATAPAPVNVSAFDSVLQQSVVQLPISPAGNLQPGDTLRLRINVLADGYTYSQEIIKLHGVSNIAAQDPASNLNSWTHTGWGTTTATFVSPPAAITDSPGQEYSNMSSTNCRWDQIIDLIDADAAEFRCWAQWEVEKAYDVAKIQVRPLGGNWQDLCNEYAVAGSDDQGAGEPLFEARQTVWELLRFDLSPYVGQQIELRFLLDTDLFVTRDGFYFDDPTVETTDYQNFTNLQPHSPEHLAFQAWPNPASGQLNLEINGEPGTRYQLSLLNITGQEVVQKQVTAAQNNVQQISLAGLAPGVYLLRVRAEYSGRRGQQKIIVR